MWLSPGSFVNLNSLCAEMLQISEVMNIQQLLLLHQRYVGVQLQFLEWTLVLPEATELSFLFIISSSNIKRLTRSVQFNLYVTLYRSYISLYQSLTTNWNDLPLLPLLEHSVLIVKAAIVMLFCNNSEPLILLWRNSKSRTTLGAAERGETQILMTPWETEVTAGQKVQEKIIWTQNELGLKKIKKKKTGLLS